VRLHSGLIDPELVPDACERLAGKDASGKPMLPQLGAQQLSQLCRSLVSLG